MSSGTHTALLGPQIVTGLGDVENGVIAGVWTKIFTLLPMVDKLSGRLVCKTFAQDIPTVTSTIKFKPFAVDNNQEYISQRQFQRISSTFKNLEELTIIYDYTDDFDTWTRKFNNIGDHTSTGVDWEQTPLLDFSNVQLHKLKTLTLKNVPLASLHFTQENTPCLQQLSCSNSGYEDWETGYYMAAINLDLLSLKTLSVSGVTLQESRSFVRSMNACTNLTSFESQWLQGLHEPPVLELNLPECTSMSYYESDVQGLQLRAPKLQSIELLTCCSCHHIRFTDGEGLQVGVTLVNSMLDPATMTYLKGHPRVGSGNISSNNDDEDGNYDDYDDHDDDHDINMEYDQEIDYDEYDDYEDDYEENGFPF